MFRESEHKSADSVWLLSAAGSPAEAHQILKTARWSGIRDRVLLWEHFPSYTKKRMSF